MEILDRNSAAEVRVSRSPAPQQREAHPRAQAGEMPSRTELRSLLVEHDAPAPQPSAEAERRAQAATDRLMLRGIDIRADLRLDRPPSLEGDRMIAVADVSAFRHIRDPGLREDAAVQIAHNARESQAYKAAIVEAGIAGEIESLNARKTASMLAEAERDAPR